MDKREAINKVKEYSILPKNYVPFENEYLFGSYAKSTIRADRDTDVAIAVNHVDGDYFSIQPPLWKLRRQGAGRIEPVLTERGNDNGGFLIEIPKNGLEIA